MSSTFLSYISRWALFAGVLILLGGSVMLSRLAVAAGSMPITGYAWSSNIGWISFSGGTAPLVYGVFEDTTTGALSGYAWSSNFGWVSFGVPDAQHPAPGVDLSTGKVTGWVRACAAFADKNACGGALDLNSGGWDGWISLSGTATDGVSTYGITQSSTCAWTGYAWGSDAIGWISASGIATDGSSTYGVSGNDPATCAGTSALPTVTLSANPTSVASGGSSVLTWSSTNSPTSCTASGDWSGLKDATAGSHSETITNITSNKTFTLTCTNGSGSGAQSATVTVSNLPTATLNANPSAINSGQSSMLTWSSTNVTSCTAAGGFSTGGATSGSVSTGPLTSTQNYQINCTGPGSVNSNIATVTVSSPLVSISANPTRLRSGNTSIISWTSSDVDSCNISGPGLSSSALIGSSPPIVINFQSTFTITCQKNSSPVTRSVTVNVVPSFQEF